MVNGWIIRAVETVQNLGWLGPAVFVLLYVLLTVLLIPGSLLTLVAGFLYGPLYGILLASPASVTAATAAFLLGRTAFRERVERQIRARPFLRSLDSAVERSGFKLILLLRLSPVFPFVLLNYSLGLTRVAVGDYVIASAIGMLPGTLFYVYLGSLAYNVSQLLAGGSRAGIGNALYWGGLVATGILTVVLTRMARRALAEARAGQEPAPTQIEP